MATDQDVFSYAAESWASARMNQRYSSEKVEVVQVKKRIVIGVVASIIASPAFAACTKPVGTYVGGGGGPIINNGSSELVYSEEIFSITVASTGMMTVNDTGSSTSGGNYARSFVVPPINNTFSTTTCTGTLTASTTLTFFYSVADGGATITLIVRGGTAGQQYWAPTTYVLKKV